MAVARGLSQDCLFLGTHRNPGAPPLPKRLRDLTYHGGNQSDYQGGPLTKVASESLPLAVGVRTPYWHGYGSDL